MKPAAAPSPDTLVLDTKPLVPLHVRHRAAQRRLLAAFGAVLDPRKIAHLLDLCIADLRRLGICGPGLIVAAEHMAATRLRELVQLLNDASCGGDGAAGQDESPEARPKMAVTPRNPCQVAAASVPAQSLS